MYTNTNNTPGPSDITEETALPVPLKVQPQTQITGKENKKNSKKEGEYSSLFESQIQISSDQAKTKEFYITIIVTNKGTLPWPKNTKFKMLKKRKTLLSIDDIIVKDGILLTGEKVYISTKVTLLTDEKKDGYTFQGYIYNKIQGPIGKVVKFTLTITF